jgi:putative PIN family toxin of toxin-antitoxin system
MRIVLDTNVLVSALIKSGKPRELIFEIVKNKVQLITSRKILEEFIKITDAPRIRKYVGDDDTIAFLRAIGSIASVVKVRSKFKVINEDPDDDMVLRTAQDGRAEYIVSGDKHLLSLKEFRGIKIVTVTQMLNIIRKVKG